MNTSKQVNAMIGLLFLAFLAFGAYIVNENNRADAARENQAELLAHRGAELFVNNCRSCHGLEGLGQAEGAIAPPLNRESFLVMGEGNPYGVPATPEGEERALREFLFNTIACGRTGTAMPLWSERYGGSMSETQVNYIVDMITQGRWDLVREIGHEHDVETGDTPEDILLQEGFAITQRNCGQYNALTAREFHERDPFAAAPGPGEPTPTAAPGETPEPGGPADAMVQGLRVGDFFLAMCASCHGAQREGGIGPALTPARLTEDDLLYFETIRDGRAGTAMPSWRDVAGLTDEEIDALVQYIKNVAP